MTRTDAVFTRGPATAFEESLTAVPRARWNRGRILRALLGAVLALAVVVPLVWWQVEARTYRLSTGGTYGAPAATTLVAGNATELCFPEVAGASISFMLSVANNGNHVLTLTSVGRVFIFAPQTVRADAQTDGGASGPATQRLPLTIRPGQSRNLYFTVTVPSGQSYSSSHSVADVVDLHFRVLGVNRTQHFVYGQGGTSTLWFGLSGKDDDGRFCDYTTPPV